MITPDRNLKHSKCLSVDDSLNKLRNGYPLQYSCLDNSMDRGAQWATVRGVIVFLYIRNEQLEFEIKNVLWFTVTSKNK